MVDLFFADALSSYSIYYYTLWGLVPTSATLKPGEYEALSIQCRGDTLCSPICRPK